ncbi:hypothetical protein GCM10009682_19480 [Luedemannella flava]|uniref:Uncharacterized protein n=1 Tax=Luedemannella flava TaxID=349316 RepID=A0ABP4Y168_9ACTN
MGKTAAGRRESGRTRLTFRQWRRSRPFWGGLFFVLSGLLLLFSSHMDLNGLQIHVGVEGFLSYLLPLLMLLSGLLLWFTPQQRIFYSAIGTVTALYSFVGLNFGGLGCGMLFGMIGGALAFAWAPVRPAAAPADQADPSSDDDHQVDAPADTTVDSANHGSDNGVLPWFGASDSPGASADSPTAAQPPAPRHYAAPDESRPANGARPNAQWPGRTLSLIVVPALIVAAVAAGALSGSGTANAAGVEPTPLVAWLLGEVAGDSTEEPTATPTGAAPTTATEPTGAPGTTAPSTAVPGTTSAPRTTGAPDDTSAPSTTSGPATTSAPVTTAPPTMTLPKTTLAGNVVAVKDSVLTTAKLTVKDLTYAGVAVLSTATGATKTTLELRSGTLRTAAVRLTGNGSVMTADSLTIGGATVFVTSLTGKLGGVEITITPTAVPPLGDAFELTDVTVHLALVQGDELSTPGMKLSLDR